MGDIPALIAEGRRPPRRPEGRGTVRRPTYTPPVPPAVPSLLAFTLAEELEARGLADWELAYKTRLALCRIRRILKHGNPDERELAGIAAALNISAEYLAALANTPDPALRGGQKGEGR